MASSQSIRINAPLEAGEVEMPPPEDPVKVEKLPLTLKTSGTNVEKPPESTRENQYARLIKKLADNKAAEKKVAAAQAKASNQPVEKSISISAKSTLDP